MNLKFLKKQNNKWTMVALLAVIVLVYLAYTCAKPQQQKEYFVVKAKSPMGEVLLDQTDFAEIINGMKPKHVKGEFTADDLSELVRELKKNTISQYKTHCKRSPKSCPSIGKDILALIDETNKTKTGKMTKSQWIDAIVSLSKTVLFRNPSRVYTKEEPRPMIPARMKKPVKRGNN